MEVEVAEYQKGGSQRQKLLWTGKEDALAISGRWCENQGDQINLARALDSKSTKHCPCQTAAHSGLASSSTLPLPHTPYTWHHPVLLKTYVQRGQPPVSRAEQSHLPVSREPCHNQAGGQYQGPTVGEQVARNPQQPQRALQQPGHHHCPRHLVKRR